MLTYLFEINPCKEKSSHLWENENSNIWFIIFCAQKGVSLLCNKRIENYKHGQYKIFKKQWANKFIIFGNPESEIQT